MKKTGLPAIIGLLVGILAIPALAEAGPRPGNAVPGRPGGEALPANACIECTKRSLPAR